MPDKKQPEKISESAEPKKVLTEAEKGREAAAEAHKIAEATLSRYMSWVENLKGRHAFRGQANAEWLLRSSAYRRLLNMQIKHRDLAGFMFVGYLHERVDETMIRFSAHSDQQPLKVMALMQHHGAATGLIDFTESALAALWFACKDEQDKPGKIVAVRLDDDEKITEIKKHKDIERPLEDFFPIEPDKKLWAWRPGDGDSRMVTQQSLFIFGRPEIGEEFINDEFIVLAEEKRRYMEILGRMGVSENFIFSDFFGFSAANASGKDYPLHLAEIYYEEKVKESPQNALYHFQKGVSNAAQSAYEKAIADFTRAIELEPQHVAAYDNRGNALHFLGRHEEAIVDFTRAIELEPQHAEAYINRGSTLNDVGRHEEAIADCTCAIELGPPHAEAYVGRGNALNDVGRHEEAIADFTRAIELEPQHVAAYINRGSTLNNMGRHEEAIADCTRAIELGPPHAEAYYNRGLALAYLNRHEDALVNYDCAIELDPQYMEAHNNRGVALAYLERYEGALSDFTRAIELEPQRAEAYINRGSTLNDVGRHEDAIPDFTRAIDLEPQCAGAYNNRGLALAYLERYEKAIPDFTRAIELNSQYAEAHTGRGVAYCNLNRHEDAISDWKEAIRIGEQTGNKNAVQSATSNLAVLSKRKK